MPEDAPSRPDQEGFGEASLGEAQSSNPPADPEMIEDEPVPQEGHEPADTQEEPSGDSEGGAEGYGGDADAGPASAEPGAGEAPD